eukprot:scaffold10310_cov109-Isochrysis_galbana.AAC.3
MTGYKFEVNSFRLKRIQETTRRVGAQQGPVRPYGGRGGGTGLLQSYVRSGHVRDTAPSGAHASSRTPGRMDVTTPNLAVDASVHARSPSRVHRLLQPPACRLTAAR